MLFSELILEVRADAISNEIDVWYYKKGDDHIILYLDGDTDPICYVVADVEVFMDEFKRNRTDHESDVDAFWDTIQDHKVDKVVNPDPGHDNILGTR